MVFVYCDLVAPEFVADQNLRTLRINSLPVERRGTPFSKCLLYPRGKKSLSRYQYSDATDGRFNNPFRRRFITRKNGTTFSTCGINTRDVSSYRHYRSRNLSRGIIFTRLAVAVAVAAAGEGSDLSIRSHPSFSEATVWAVFWADYFGRLDLSFSPAYALLAKLWVGRH